MELTIELPDTYIAGGPLPKWALDLVAWAWTYSMRVRIVVAIEE